MKQQRWILRAAVAAAACVVSGVITLHVTRSSAGAQVGPRSFVPDLTLGAPATVASLTQEKAVEVALKDDWAQSLFSHPVSFQYGSYNAGIFVNNQPPRLRDVWMIKITGLNIPRPGGRSGAPLPPPIHTLVIYVDDKAGTVLKAQGF